MTDRRIRADIARFARASTATRSWRPRRGSRDVTVPARIVWGTDDRNFTLETGRRLAAAFADGELVEVPGVSTFVSDRRTRRRRRRHRRTAGRGSARRGRRGRTGHVASVS